MAGSEDGQAIGLVVGLVQFSQAFEQMVLRVVKEREEEAATGSQKTGRRRPRLWMVYPERRLGRYPGPARQQGFKGRRSRRGYAEDRAQRDIATAC